jgi:hypothetical protein
MIRVEAPINLDVNSGNPMGVGIVPTFAADGYRTTSASANLKERPDSLLIWTDTIVGKIIFQGVDAIGVETVDGRKGNTKFHPFQTHSY